MSWLYAKPTERRDSPTSGKADPILGKTDPVSGAGKEKVPSRAPARQRGVLLINLGTPETPDVPDVRRYLTQFLSDPEVIHLPRGLGWLNRPLGRLIAQLRAPRSAVLYRRIWSERGSPLDSITAEQASLLGEALPAGWHAFYAMRYGRPSIAKTLEEIAASGIDELVVVPMYPQFSGSTTRTALRELYRCLERSDHRISVTTRNTWYDDGGYIHAQAKLIERYARLHGVDPSNAHLVFSAHGLPVSYVERGDPYPAHVARTVKLVTERLGWPRERMSIAYQSRLGPAEWLRPNTPDVLNELAQRGEKRLLVCPISFTVDCLETLEEIDVRCRGQVEEAGAELYLCPALNADGLFVSALSNIVLRGARSVSSWGGRVRPLIPGPAKLKPKPGDYDALVMVGVSLPNRVGGDRGPQQVHASEASLHKIKKSQMDMPGILRKICEHGNVREAMVWNTCSRFEFYGWPGDQDETVEGECIVRRVRRHLFGGCEQEEVPVNILCGADAWHHLMRTVVGLNSGLPGDRDVVEQLQTSHRLAQRAGTAGPRLDGLISEAVALERDVRDATEWGGFDPGYCFAAISRIVETTGVSPTDCCSVVIGGSTTSRSVLAALMERFEVPSRLLTLIYRGHTGGQIKELRKAIGNGKRIRVQSYAERQVRRAIADADIVFFGIDRNEPVLNAEDIRDCRDFTSRPLTVIDFNTFGSTTGLETIPGVTLIDAEALDDAVAAFADAMCATESFAHAVRGAEERIIKRIPTLKGESTTPQRCHRSIGKRNGAAGGRRAVRVEDRWRRCVQCSGEPRVGEAVAVEELS